MPPSLLLPENLALLDDFSDLSDPERPNRLCVCISDVHFTDGTVGSQSAEQPVWEAFFEEVEETCISRAIEELTLVLDGDVIDMIRTSAWAQAGVYPWQRDHPEFPIILQDIIKKIASIHGQAPDSPHCHNDQHSHCNFFYLLKRLPDRLKGKGRQGKDIHVQTLVLLGNHDKEILLDPIALKIFYEECLGQKVAELSDDYRRWIGRQYGDESLFLAKDSVPWLPFYHGDRGFRLFLTHGQWRDRDNSRAIAGWNVNKGWDLGLWQQSRFEPFRAACFGDSVAAGLLSTFIYKAKAALETYSAQKKTMGIDPSPEITRLSKILDELDLYRPTYAAIERILLETRKMRAEGKGADAPRIIEDNLYQCINLWLSWDFTFQTAGGFIGPLLRIAKLILGVLGTLPGHRIELEMIYWLSKSLARFQDFSGYRDTKISLKKMRKFPGFLPAYRDYGFRIHGEGHTHVALEEDVYFEAPDTNKNYTYINFGTWRDRIVKKQTLGYRRRGIGRALLVLDLKPKNSDEARQFTYYIQDALSWSDRRDRF